MLLLPYRGGSEKLRQNNRSMIIQNIVIRERVKQITQELIGGYNIEFK